MPTDGIATQRVILIKLSCGCEVGFRCPPSHGDLLYCTRCEISVRAIKMPKEVA